MISLALCFSLLLLIGWLCEEVLEKELFGFDRAILLSIHQWASPQLDNLMITLTRLGDPEWVIVVVIATLVWFGLKRRYSQVVMFTIALAGAFVLNTGMKLIFAKPRPELWPRLIPETSFSFPSGHALGSMVLYGVLAYLLSRLFPQKSMIFYGISAVVIGAIGLSRLYLGVHWPTDIFAGYGVGFLWVMMNIAFFNWQTQTKSIK
ncbi:MAG: phosphatase PAP2 family protein [Alkalinema sp. CAN_BIN05]|nr:phosphatase PAP2 family protein [Alkalinema sp. CAN_BIN05]